MDFGFVYISSNFECMRQCVWIWYRLEFACMPTKISQSLCHGNAQYTKNKGRITYFKNIHCCVYSFSPFTFFSLHCSCCLSLSLGCCCASRRTQQHTKQKLAYECVKQNRTKQKKNMYKMNKNEYTWRKRNVNRFHGSALPLPLLIAIVGVVGGEFLIVCFVKHD